MIVSQKKKLIVMKIEIKIEKTDGNLACVYDASETLILNKEFRKWLEKMKNCGHGLSFDFISYGYILYCFNTHCSNKKIFWRGFTQLKT